MDGRTEISSEKVTGRCAKRLARIGEGLRRVLFGAAVGCVFRRAPRRRLQQAHGAIDWAPQAETSQFRAPVSRDRLGLLSYKIPQLFFTHLPKSVFFIPQANFFLVETELFRSKKKQVKRRPR